MKKVIILMAVPALLCTCDLWANEQLNQQLRSAAAAGDAVRAEHLLDRGADIEASDVPLPIAEESLIGNVERLDFFRGIDRITAETSDESFFIVTPLIGYRPDDDVMLQELIQRAPQIKERIEYFSSRSVEELQDADDRARVKRDLIEEINQMMENNIRDVVFDDYSF